MTNSPVDIGELQAQRDALEKEIEEKRSKLRVINKSIASTRGERMHSRLMPRAPDVAVRQAKVDQIAMRYKRLEIKR